MTRVRWEELERAPLYEDIVAVLLSRLHPDAERIDGTGGDGGRDVQIRVGNKLTIFELKSFVGRVGRKSPNRRAQVERSLRNAATLQPDSWTLVVPIDHNPDELDWFDGLRRKYPFPLHWCGRTWLDLNLGEFPDISKYYLEGAKDEAIELIREINSDSFDLANGIDGAIRRLEVINARLNQIDPQYRFDIVNGPIDAARISFPRSLFYHETGSNETRYTVCVHEKYRNATRDRPILINLSFNFPKTDIGEKSATELRRFFDYGDPVAIDEQYVEDIDIQAPGGLGGARGKAAIWMGPPADRSEPPLQAQIIVLNRERSRIRSLPISFTDRYRGERGVTLLGADGTGLMHLTLRFDLVDNQAMFNIGVSPVTGLMPSVLLPSLRVAQSLRVPNYVSIAVGGREIWPPQPLPSDALVEDSYVELVESLARVQLETGAHFGLPDNITGSEVADLRRMVKMLDGEAIAIKPKPFTFTLHPGAQRPWETNGNSVGNLAIEAEFVEMLMGEEINVGTCNVIGGPWRFVDSENRTGGAAGENDVRVEPTDETRCFLRKGSVRGADHVG